MLPLMALLRTADLAENEREWYIPFVSAATMTTTAAGRYITMLTIAPHVYSK